VAREDIPFPVPRRPSLTRAGSIEIDGYLNTEIEGVFYVILLEMLVLARKFLALRL
jgi:hypothetical protein